MKTPTQKVQTGIRLTPELMERVKRSAKRENRSFNSYVEYVLERATEPVFPTIGPDFKVSDEVLALRASTSFKRPPQEVIDADPKLAYLLESNGL